MSTPDGRQVEIDRLRKDLDFAKALHADAEDRAAALRSDNARLRALIEESVTANKDFRPVCVWCRCSTESRIDVEHEFDCPAFTPEGEVK